MVSRDMLLDIPARTVQTGRRDAGDGGAERDRQPGRLPLAVIRRRVHAALNLVTELALILA